MFKKIAIACNESLQADRALLAALQLAQSLGAGVRPVTVMTPPPAYHAFAGATDASLSQTLVEDWLKFYDELQEKACTIGRLRGIEGHSHRVEGREVETIVPFLREQKADLLVPGLHQRDLYLAQLWSTVYELAQ